MLETHSQLHRQMRILRQNERRRRYRAWVQAFQLGMLLLFADQILKTYCGSQLLEHEMRPIAGQSVLSLTRIPDHGALAAVSAHLPASLAKLPAMALAVFWGLVLLALVFRARQAGFGELLAFALVLGGAGSSLLSRHLTSSVYDTLALRLGGDRFIAFSVGDVGVLVGSYFLIRMVLSLKTVSWKPSRNPL